ncbi:diguanylate cyclase domain-containing protein [Scleromatobacter humisilvae]|uniref:Diguanylate cyclase n=1 Tax=Scleromatobacter humisilvae TaxID=2897159 RepID=A0A9X1YFD7_9BURK|nr:diguanylate cyclase [Scleromatobacter humisilvae]MCK9684657.1 diguanylate cyclase [Scleromatobacter humisilvae]
MNLPRSRLQYRFPAGALAAALVFALIAGALAYALGERRANEAAHQTIAGMQAAVEKTAAIAVYAHDAPLMREVLEGVARNSLVRQVDIVDDGGRTLLQGSGRAAPVHASEAVVLQPLKSPFDAGETIGAMRIEIDGDQLQRVARREAWLMALLMVGQAALIAMIVFLTGARLVSRPIVRLARALAMMPPGSTQLLPTPRGHAHDEIGTLVQSANDLLSANAQALQRERELRQDIEAMEAQYRQIFDSTSAGIFVLDRQGRLINGNPTVLKVIGGGVRDLRQMRGRDFLELVFARPERARAMIEQAALRNETMSADLELRAAEGRTRWAHCLLSVQEARRPDETTDSMAMDGVVEGVLYDITERKQVETDVRRRADHDALTGALNRNGIDEAIDRHLAHGDATDALTLLYLDLDGFKQINDRHGHHHGDEVLQQAVQRIQSELRRNTDLVGRIGGDEFVVALAHSGPTDVAASQIAASIVARLCEPFELDGGRAVAEIGVSIGMASFPRHGRQRRELMHAADEAMYWVKRHGKNGYATALAEK